MIGRERINDNLAIVGTFVEFDELGTAFLFENDTVTIIDPCPGEAENCLALAGDINNLGVIVGSYDLDGFDATGERIGFIATPSSSSVPMVPAVGLVALAALLVLALLARVRVARPPSG